MQIFFTLTTVALMLCCRKQKHASIKCMYACTYLNLHNLLACDWWHTQLKQKLNTIIYPLKQLENYDNKNTGKRTISLYQSFNGFHSSMGSSITMAKTKFGGPSGPHLRGNDILKHHDRKGCPSAPPSNEVLGCNMPILMGQVDVTERRQSLK